MPLDSAGVHARIRDRFGDAIGELVGSGRDASCTVEPSRIAEVCRFLKEDAALQFNMAPYVTAVDYLGQEPRFEVVYHLLSIPRKERVRIKTKLDGSSPAIESVTSVWPSANFYEREVFDLFGVRFSGHPNLKRIMMPDNWEGHPLRKDYPVEGYR